MIKEFKLQFPILIFLFIYTYILYFISVPIEKIDYASFFFEAILITMPVAGIFLINSLKNTSLKSFRFLLIGLSLLSISMITDTIDEIVYITEIQDAILEGLLEVLGFMFLIFGLHSWNKHNQEVNTNLNKIATTDYLTGICNRRSFMSILESNITLSKNQNTNLSMILLDIDNFKRINDNYGHDVGDIVLLKITNIVNKNIRNVDVFARFGGEEFVILMPNTKLQDSTEKAKKLCKLIEESQEMPIDKVTASFGVTILNKDDNLDTLLKRTDNAMYEAKKTGKNKVVAIEN